MAGWPSLDRVDDRRLAQALRGGDVDAMAQIYDGYADRLYDYCHALLRDRDAAAGALHDALIVAQAHIARLREPERFRSWIYAIVRNECLRRLYDPNRPAERNEAPEIEDPFLDVDERTRLQETRQLVHSALSGLNGRQREATDLALRHDLDVQELGGVLGLTAQQAAELAGNARAMLDDALAAAIIARSGRGECPSVAALVDTWEWPLTPTVCRKLIRHIETCPICGERRKRKVSTTRLLQVLPIAALPPELRQELLNTATAADLNEERMALAHRAEPFDVWGWPTSLDRNARTSGKRGQGVNKLWPAVAAAACVLLVVGGVFLYLPRSADKPSGSPAQGPVAGADPSTPAVVSPSDATDGAADSAEPTNTPTTAPPTTHIPTTRRPSTRPTTHKPSTKPPTKPKPGTLSVSGCGDIGTAKSCSVTLTASGGTVRWSVASVPTGLSASGSGTLAAGASTQVAVHVTDPCTDGNGGSGSVTFSPSGSASVVWGC